MQYILTSTKEVMSNTRWLSAELAAVWFSKEPIEPWCGSRNTSSLSLTLWDKKCFNIITKGNNSCILMIRHIKGTNIYEPVELVQFDWMEETTGPLLRSELCSVILVSLQIKTECSKFVWNLLMMQFSVLNKVIWVDETNLQHTYCA